MSDKWYVYINMFFFVTGVMWIVLVGYMSEHDPLFINDTQFEHIIYHAMDAFDYMDLLRQGKAEVKKLDIGTT
jgi:hypothetical protein